VKGESKFAQLLEGSFSLEKTVKKSVKKKSPTPKAKSKNEGDGVNASIHQSTHRQQARQEQVASQPVEVKSFKNFKSASEKKEKEKSPVSGFERESELYFLGVRYRNLLDEIDYTYDVLTRLHKYYHSEIKGVLNDKKEVARKIEEYLSKIKKYDEEVIREMIKVIVEYELLDTEYEFYATFLNEIKEAYKKELLETLPLEVRSDVYFLEGFERR
jgi:hypothetical protein